MKHEEIAVQEQKAGSQQACPRSSCDVLARWEKVVRSQRKQGVA